MGDLYIVDVSLNLPTSVPEAVLTDLRWHLGLADSVSDDMYGDEFPVWSARGPAKRIGGVRVGDLLEGPQGWYLTVRQEVHVDYLPDVEALIGRLACHSTTHGLIGQTRHFEDHVPEMLINHAGTVTKVPLRYSKAEPC
ncbi:hypothetical protein ABZ705_11215 [Streptomyces sp. NPDC006984]|uniref:hypothetical protein n=1 Tax=Streptomyces sp. NPDC006984 TaxID=3155463 RepID=UPI0033C14EC8